MPARYQLPARMQLPPCVRRARRVYSIMHRIRLTISGMSCAHCAAALRKELERLEGVTVHAVDIGAADISFPPERTTIAVITDAVRRAGYAVADGGA